MIYIFYNDYWLGPIRKHLHLNNIDLLGTKTNEDGIAIESIEGDEFTKFYNIIINELDPNNKSVDDLYDIIINKQVKLQKQHS